MKYAIRQIAPQYQEDTVFHQALLFAGGYDNLVVNPGLQHTNVHGPVYNRSTQTVTCTVYDHVMMYLEQALCDWAELGNEQQTKAELLDILLSYDFRPPQTSHLRPAPHTLTVSQTWTPEEMELWRSIFDGRNCADDDVVVMSVLELLTGHEWVAKILNGGSQSDWVSVLYDSTMYTDDFIESFRVSLFNLGSEWEFFMDYEEVMNDKEPGSEITEEDFCSYETYTAYLSIECPTVDQIKEWAAEMTCDPDCSPTEVVLFKHVGERIVQIYEEV